MDVDAGAEPPPDQGLSSLLRLDNGRIGRIHHNYLTSLGHVPAPALGQDKLAGNADKIKSPLWVPSPPIRARAPDQLVDRCRSTARCGLCYRSGDAAAMSELDHMPRSVKNHVRKREARQGPRCGDWVIMPDGALERLTSNGIGETSSWVS